MPPREEMHVNGRKDMREGHSHAKTDKVRKKHDRYDMRLDLIGQMEKTESGKYLIK